MRAWEDYKKTMKTTPDLWKSAKTNDLSTIQALIQNGASINEKDSRGYSPLMLAVYSGHFEATKLLLQSGADANSFDLGGNTILMGASFKGHTEIIKILIEFGADVTARNSSGLTAIHFAKTFGRSEAAQLLEKFGSKNPVEGRIVGLIKILLGRYQSS